MVFFYQEGTKYTVGSSFQLINYNISFASLCDKQGLRTNQTLKRWYDVRPLNLQIPISVTFQLCEDELYVIPPRLSLVEKQASTWLSL